jgi:hypothetical protein
MGSVSEIRWGALARGEYGRLQASQDSLLKGL